MEHLVADPVKERLKNLDEDVGSLRSELAQARAEVAALHKDVKQILTLVKMIKRQ